MRDDQRRNPRRDALAPLQSPACTQDDSLIERRPSGRQENRRASVRLIPRATTRRGGTRSLRTERLRFQHKEQLVDVTVIRFIRKLNPVEQTDDSVDA